MEITKVLTSGRIWWLAVTLHRICIIIIIYSFEIGWGAEEKVCEPAPFSVGSFYFCFRCLWLMCPIMEESIFLTKEEPAFPGGHRLFMYQIYFLLPWPPRIHTAFITGGVMEIEFTCQGPHMHCVTWVQCEGLLPSLRLDLHHSWGVEREISS